MSETLKLQDLVSDEAPSHFVVAAVGRTSPEVYAKFFETFDRRSRVVDITFQINSIDVPFVDTIEHVYNLMSYEIERKAAVLAGSKKTLHETIDLVKNVHDMLWKHLDEKLDPLRDGRLPDDADY